MIKILIVEDQIIVREALKNSLDSYEDLEVVATMGDASLTTMFCEKYPVDLVLMDICTENDASGISNTARLKQVKPDVKVLMMTGLPEMNFIERSREAGADGFVYKDLSLEDLVDVIRRTMEGEKIFPLDQPVEFTLEKMEFTNREEDILYLICEGLSRKEVAEELGLTENTVKWHFNNLLTKTGYTSISKLAIFAVSNGYVNTKF